MKVPKKQLVAAIAVPVLYLSSGCDTGSLPSAEHAGGPKAPAVAKKAAREVFETRFARKGGSYYTVKVITHPDTTVAFAEYMNSAMKGQVDFGILEKEFHPQLLYSMELIELKGLRTRFEGLELSEADRLNGITWKGTVVVETESERRRDLDLKSSFEALARGDEEVAIDWTESPIIWRPSEAARSNLKNYLERANAESDEISEEERLMRVWAMMGDQFLEVFLEGYASTEWYDWWTPEGNSYQMSEVVVRNGKAEITTLESVENVIADNESVALFMPGLVAGGVESVGGMFGSLFSASILDTQESFLLRPNLNALTRHELLE